EVGDHPIPHGANDGYALGGPSEHLSGVAAHGDDLVIRVRDRDDRWFLEDNTLSSNVNQNVGSTEVNADLLGEHPLPDAYYSACPSRVVVVIGHPVTDFSRADRRKLWACA